VLKKRISQIELIIKLQPLLSIFSSRGIEIYVEHLEDKCVFEIYSNKAATAKIEVYDKRICNAVR